MWGDRISFLLGTKSVVNGWILCIVVLFGCIAENETDERAQVFVDAACQYPALLPSSLVEYKTPSYSASPCPSKLFFLRL